MPAKYPVNLHPLLITLIKRHPRDYFLNITLRDSSRAQIVFFKEDSVLDESFLEKSNWTDFRDPGLRAHFGSRFNPVGSGTPESGIYAARGEVGIKRGVGKFLRI